MKHILRSIIVYSILSIILSGYLFADELKLDQHYEQSLLTDSQVILHSITIENPSLIIIQVDHEEVNPEVGWRIRLSDSQLQSLVDFSVTGATYTVSSPRLRLAEGSYNLRLSAGEAYTPGKFTLSFAVIDEGSLATELESNGTSESANALELNKVFLGNSQNNSDLDYFRVEITEPGILSVQVEANRAADGQHWSWAFFEEQVILSDDLYLNVPLEMSIQPGIFYLVVKPTDGSWSDVDYRVWTRFSASEEVKDPDSTSIQLNINEEYQGNITANSPSLEFIFGVLADIGKNHNTIFTWQSNLVERVVYILQDSDKNIIQQGILLDVNTFSLLFTLPAGNYHLSLKLNSSDNLDYQALLYDVRAMLKGISLKIGSTDLEIYSDYELQEPVRSIDTSPVIIEGRALLPIRVIVEELGGIINWDATEQRITIFCRGHRVEMTIGISSFVSDSITHDMDIAPMIIQGRTMLPVRFVAEALGCFVTWDNDAQMISISY